MVFPFMIKVAGTHQGRPRYVEQNKQSGDSFGASVTGSEIVYCDEIDSWVFMHENISTTPQGVKENECSWLWRSPETEDFDILTSAGSDWKTWMGEVKSQTHVSITCIECTDRSDCSYHGDCGEDGLCSCDPSHFGHLCELEMPCKSLATEKAHTFGKDM